MVVVAGVNIPGSPLEQERPRTGGDAVRCCPGELKNAIRRRDYTTLSRYSIVQKNIL